MPRKKPEEFEEKKEKNKIIIRDDEKFNFSIGFSVVALGITLTLWGASNFCAKNPNCNMTATFLLSSNLGVFVIISGLFLMIIGLLSYLHTRKYQIS